MILHCSKKLATKLDPVSLVPLEETNPLGCWHGRLLTIDRWQCVIFCHDATRFVLLLAGLRKAQFDELGSKWFPQLFTAALATIGCADEAIMKAELALWPVRYDTATERSVMGAIKHGKTVSDLLIDNHG